MPANRCIDCNAKLPDDGSDDAVCAKCAAKYGDDDQTPPAPSPMPTWDAAAKQQQAVLGKLAALGNVADRVFAIHTRDGIDFPEWDYSVIDQTTARLHALLDEMDATYRARQAVCAS